MSRIRVRGTPLERVLEVEETDLERDAVSGPDTVCETEYTKSSSCCGRSLPLSLCVASIAFVLCFPTVLIWKALLPMQTNAIWTTLLPMSIPSKQENVSEQASRAKFPLKRKKIAFPTDGGQVMSSTGGAQPASPTDGTQSATMTGGTLSPTSTGGDQATLPTDEGKVASLEDVGQIALPTDGEQFVRPPGGSPPLLSTSGDPAALPADGGGQVAMPTDERQVALLEEVGQVATPSDEGQVPSQENVSPLVLSTDEGQVALPKDEGQVATGEGQVALQGGNQPMLPTGDGQMASLTDESQVALPTGEGQVGVPADEGQVAALEDESQVAMPTGEGQVALPGGGQPPLPADEGQVVVSGGDQPQLPADEGQVASSADEGQVASSVNDGQVVLPVGEGQVALQASEGQVALPVDAGQVAPLVDEGQAALLVDEGQVALPVDVGQVAPLVDEGQEASLVDEGQVALQTHEGQVASEGQMALPVDAGQAALPVDAGQVAPLVDEGQVASLVDERQVASLVDEGQVAKPVDEGQVALPTGEGQMELPGGGQPSLLADEGTVASLTRGSQTAEPTAGGQSALVTGGGEPTSLTGDGQSPLPPGGDQSPLSIGHEQTVVPTGGKESASLTGGSHSPVEGLVGSRTSGGQMAAAVTTVFPNSTRLKALSCPSWFDRALDADFSPWEERGGIEAGDVEAARAHAIFCFQVIDNMLYIEQDWQKREMPISATVLISRSLRTMWGILMLLQHFPGAIPNIEACFNSGYLPQISKTQNPPRDTPLPILIGYTSDGNHVDIPFPEFDNWEIPGTTQRVPWPVLPDTVFRATKRLPFADRTPKLFWSGKKVRTGDLRGAPGVRSDVLRCAASKRYDKLFEIGTTMEGSRERVSVEGSCKYQYQLYMEGISSSPSLKHKMACGSILLYINSSYHTYYDRGLIPWVHYLPVHREHHFQCKYIMEGMDWIKHHKQSAEKMGKRVQAFVREDINVENTFSYMFHLFRRYSALQTFTPTLRSTTYIKVTKEFLTAAAGGVLQREPAEKAPGRPPCEIYIPLGL